MTKYPDWVTAPKVVENLSFVWDPKIEQGSPVEALIEATDTLRAKLIELSADPNIRIVSVDGPEFDCCGQYNDDYCYGSHRSDNLTITISYWITEPISDEIKQQRIDKWTKDKERNKIAREKAKATRTKNLEKQQVRMLKNIKAQAKRDPKFAQLIIEELGE